VVIPDPEGLTWTAWASTVAGFNPTYSQVLHPQMGWHAFARRLAIITPQAPRDGLYKTWQEWAAALKLVLGS
jgi:hypothetical protein